MKIIIFGLKSPSWGLKISIGPSNGLAVDKIWAITWNADGQFHWIHMAMLSLSNFMLYYKGSDTWNDMIYIIDNIWYKMKL